MRTLLIPFLGVMVISSACASSRPADASGSPATVSQMSSVKQFPVKAQPTHPTVGLTDYVLITDNFERDKAEAEAVIQAKIGLPYAMQTKKLEDFESILARKFVFRGEDEFFDREGYIANRVGDPERVKSADYRNVVVQFITPERALVTYSNIVEDQPGGPGSWKADMSWADVLVKEDGKWKYEIVHTIAYKDLTIPKQ
jgi:hypothetical protein